MNNHILVIDTGSTNCKASLFTVDGRVCAQAASGSSGSGPSLAESWWQAGCQAVNGLLEKTDGKEQKIAAIAVTGHMHSLALLDGHGQPLPVPTSAPAALSAQLEELSPQVADIYRRTGARLFAGAPLLWLRHLQRQFPELLRETALCLSCKDYIRFRLTGEPATEPVDAAGTLLYNLTEKNWDASLAELAGISLRQLPPLRSSLDLAGTLLPEPARELGLKAGSPVVVGAGDDIEILGGGLIRPGTCLEHLGTTGSMLICTERPVLDPQMRLELYPHVLDGLWVTGGSTNHAGGALAWARDCFSADLAECDARLRTAPLPGARSGPLFLPYLSGERCPLWNSRVRGGFFGLDSSHTKQDLLQSVFEGVAFSLRHILETAGEIGLDPDEVIAVDSSAAAPPWLQLRANIYGRRLCTPRSGGGAALGSMLLAATAVGMFPDLAGAVAGLPAAPEVIHPAAAAAAMYTDRFQTYLELSAAQCRIHSGQHP